MRKHEALIREAEVRKARSDAFSFGVFVGIILTIGVMLGTFYLVIP